MAKVSISIDDELLQRVDSYAKNNYSNRSAVITASLSQYLLQNECLQAIKGISYAMNKIADTGSCDADTLKQLESYQTLLSVYMKGSNS